MDRDFLLDMYAGQYGPEAGPWNLGLVNKYLEYKITAFFETHFPINSQDDLCNIGIGAGAWDRYLSYRLEDGKLVSIDKEELCCRQLRAGLGWEKNPNRVEVICGDAMSLHLEEKFQIVTIIGSTIQESGHGIGLLEKAMSFVAPGGMLYFQTLDGETDVASLIKLAHHQGMTLTQWKVEEKFGLSLGYYRFTK